MSTITQPSALARVIFEPLERLEVWPLDASYEYCGQLARSHYENFPVGSVLIPKGLRKHFYSIYAFARIADDFADEGYAEAHTQHERLESLEQWRRMLH